MATMKAIAVVAVLAWIGLSIGQWMPVFNQAVQALTGGR